jgi:hypothetical protein
MDFGTGLEKRLPEAFVAFTGGDGLVLKIRHTHKGVVSEDWYTAVPASNPTQPGRIKLGLGLRSHYFQATLANVDGGKFNTDDLAFYPLILDRRT